MPHFWRKYVFKWVEKATLKTGSGGFKLICYILIYSYLCEISRLNKAKNAREPLFCLFGEGIAGLWARVIRGEPTRVQALRCGIVLLKARMVHSLYYPKR